MRNAGLERRWRELAAIAYRVIIHRRQWEDLHNLAPHLDDAWLLGWQDGERALEVYLQEIRGEFPDEKALRLWRDWKELGRCSYRAGIRSCNLVDGDDIFVNDLYIHWKSAWVAGWTEERDAEDAARSLRCGHDG